MNTKWKHFILAILLTNKVVSVIANTQAETAFQHEYPSQDAAQHSYDEADLNRAIQAYKFFYPTVSIAAVFKGNEIAGLVPNKVFGIMEANPKEIMFTANSDTPYAGLSLDLKNGPIVVELPAGPLMCVVNDLNQRYVMDLGLPGPDKGKGGKHLILPPNYNDKIPSGYYTGVSSTYSVVLMLRAMPEKGDIKAAINRMKSVKIYPLKSPNAWKDTKWIDISHKNVNYTPVKWEDNLEYWKVLHEVIEKETSFEPYRAYYGELAALGIAKGKPFHPDQRMQVILEKAAQIASSQMRVQSFADRRSERVVWSDRHWEWAVLRPENGDFETPFYQDLEAREKWFYQAQIESPAMFRRTPGAGSLYWFSDRDAAGNYLDGGKTYKLIVPQPVPAKLFWSVTVYDAKTRSQVLTDQNNAALRSLIELKDVSNKDTADLYFGPNPPEGKKAVWIKTLPNSGWFTYFRIYGPEEAAFNGTWKPSDFIEVK